MVNSSESFSFRSDSGTDESKDYPTRIQIKALKLAALYMEYGLNKQAINTLEGLIDSGLKTAAIYLALGDFYRIEGSSILAKERYTEAIKLALTTGDQQVLVAATAGLAKIEAVLGKTDEASRLLQEAQDRFGTLKEVQQWSELRKRLSGLSSEDNKALIFLGGGCGDCDTGSGIGRYVWGGGRQVCIGC